MSPAMHREIAGCGPFLGQGHRMDYIDEDGAHFCGVRGRAASAPLAPKAIPPRRGGQGPPL